MKLRRIGKRHQPPYKSNFLEGNYTKYQAIIIPRDTQQTELDCGNSKVDITDAFKLLGVIIDKDLNFSQHTSQVCVRTSRMIGVLRRMKNLNPMHAKLQTAILPHLTYCSLVLVWYFYRASDTRKLERINERGLRTVFCDRVSSYSDFLSRAGWPVCTTKDYKIAQSFQGNCTGNGHCGQINH